MFAAGETLAVLRMHEVKGEVAPAAHFLGRKLPKRR
jgi:hypothetical protein